MSPPVVSTSTTTKVTWWSGRPEVVEGPLQGDGHGDTVANRCSNGGMGRPRRSLGPSSTAGRCPSRHPTGRAATGLASTMVPSATRTTDSTGTVGWGTA